MIIPPYLKPGDTVGVVAPGRGVTTEQLQFAIKQITAWGLKVALAKNLFSRNHNYLAGTDDERLMDLQGMINDYSIKAIICARGGYGTSRFIDRLDVAPLKQNPKWIVGFSDITSLHLKLIRNNVASIHATMPLLFAKEDAALSVESLRQCLFGETEIISLPGNLLNRFGEAEAPLIGGNLSLLNDSLATDTELDTAGKILMIEEIEEYYYKVDRMMNQLKRAGKLKSLAGLIVGHFTAIADTEIGFGESIQQIIRNHTSEYQYPIAFNFPFGHENPNLAWKHGDTYKLIVKESGASLM